jgi:hypothetical protein
MITNTELIFEILNLQSIRQTTNKKIKADCFLFILEDLNFITKKKKER